MIATGRTFNEIPPQLTDCAYIDCFIYSNGAAVYKKGKGLIFFSYISRKEALGVFKILDSAQTFIEIYTGGSPVVDSHKFNEAAFEYYRIDPAFLPEMRRSRIAAADFNFLPFEKDFHPEMFDVFFRDMDEREYCLKRIKSLFPQLEITSSMNNNLEIMNKGVNKGTGLQRLCEAECLDINSVIAVGDSRNDLSLFKSAGCSLAVENACPELKMISSAVICSNNDNIMPYMEKFVKESVLV